MSELRLVPISSAVAPSATVGVRPVSLLDSLVVDLLVHVLVSLVLVAIVLAILVT